MLIPPALCNGDRIAIVSPASKIDAALIDAAASQLRAEGFEPVVMPHAKGECGSFSGTSAERLADLEQAINDPAIRAILCSRGGYGAVHLLEELDRIPAAKFNNTLAVDPQDLNAMMPKSELCAASPRISISPLTPTTEPDVPPAPSLAATWRCSALW